MGRDIYLIWYGDMNPGCSSGKCSPTALRGPTEARHGPDRGVVG